MALNWAGKAPGDTYRYTWTPPLADGDGLADYSLAASGCTIDADSQDGDAVVAFISGGTAGAVATITATATSTEGEAFEETIYLPIIASTLSTAPTGQDICAFALRKIVGNGETAEADELADALERLNMMLLAWKRLGADCGVPFPILAVTSLDIPDEYVAAIKQNLKVAVHRHYGEQVDAIDMMEARAGLALVRSARLPDERIAADYY